MASSAARPNDIYAASELGGLFKSVDGGNQWFHLSGYLPTKTWGVAVDPDGMRVYATSFYDGRVDSLSGIAISLNGGWTWTRPVTATPPSGLCSELRRTQPSAFGIAIRPSAPNEVLVGTNCGLAHSTDFGTTWEFLKPIPGNAEARSVWSVVALPGGLTYVCGQDGVARSADGKTSWQKLPDPADATGPYRGYCSMAVDPSFPNAVFIVFSRVTYFDPIFDIRQSAFFASFDGGQSWIAIPHPDGEGQKRVPMVVTNRRSYGLDVWIGAGNLFRIPCQLSGSNPTCTVTDVAAWVGTFTDGKNDNQKAHGDTGDVLFTPSASIDACPLLYSSDGGIFRNTKDDDPDCHDPTFKAANWGLHAQLLLGMAGAQRPSIKAPDVYMALQDNGLFATLNAGPGVPPWTHGACCDVFDVVADATQSIVNDGARLWRGDPGFANPLVVPNTPPPAQQFYTVFTDVVDQWAPSSYVMATYDAKAGTSDVLYTTNLTQKSASDGTVQWTSLAWPAASAGIPCAVRTSQGLFFIRVFVMSGNCLSRSQNQLWLMVPISKSWKRVDVNDACPQGGFGIFEVDRTLLNRVYASCTGQNPPVMVRSDDGGETWIVDQNLTDLMIGHGAFVPQFGNPMDGATFGGVQPVMVAFDPFDTNVLLAGGYESGVFISSDGGKGWALLTDPFTPSVSGVPHLPRPFYAFFDHDASGALRDMYIGSVGRGVWRVTPTATDLQLDLKIKVAGCKPPGCDPGPCPSCAVQLEDELVHVFQVMNKGRVFTGNPIFQHSLADGLTFQSLEAPRGWRCTTPRPGMTGEVRCTASQLAPKSKSTIEVRAAVKARPGAIVRSRASVVSNAIDAQPDNNRMDTAHPVSAR
jgi:hypothetical protein